MTAKTYQEYLVKIDKLGVSSVEKLGLIAQFSTARELNLLNDQLEALRAALAPLLKKGSLFGGLLG